MNKIPKIIHQTYSSSILPDELQLIVNELKLKNPDWEYRFYDNKQREAYIFEKYDGKILDIYRSINPLYGAARADFFRYLLLYKEGGVYLDVKSSCVLPLSEIITPNDEFLLSSWPNLKGEEFEKAGIKKELKHISNGEYQQWYIMCSPNHPFLEAVINRVVHNIKNYNPWRHGVAKTGVLRLTGPIPYTLAIHPLRSQYPHRYVRTHDFLSLKYTMLKGHNTHVKMMRNHYSKNHQPIVFPKNKKDIFLYITFIMVWFVFGNPLRWFKNFVNNLIVYLKNRK